MGEMKKNHRKMLLRSPEKWKILLECGAHRNNTHYKPVGFEDFGIEYWREHMRGENISKTRCAREEGRIKIKTGTVSEDLYRIGMSFSSLSGCTTRDRRGGTREDIFVEHLP